MDWKTFRALETFSILYDIQIDEEAELGACSVSLDGGSACASESLFTSIPTSHGNHEARWPWQQRRISVAPTESWRQLGVVLRIDLARTPHWLARDTTRRLRHLPGLLAAPAQGESDPDVIQESWRLLMLVKLARATLMAHPDSAADPALDELARRLIARLPENPLLRTQEGDSRSVGRTEHLTQIFLLRVLFLCEASACSFDYQSITLADECVNLINSLSDWTKSESHGDEGASRGGSCPYELVARYNKAQGMLHSRDHSKALEEFAEVSRYLMMETDKPEDAPRYFVRASDPVVRHLRWSATDRRLFSVYIGIPALLQSAETLTNLQRSGDMEYLLERTKTSQASRAMTDYQRRRQEVLLARALLDKGGVLPTSFPEQLWPEYRLSLQQLAVLTQASKEPERRLSFIVCRVELAARDRIEFDQAMHDWVRGLEHLTGGERAWLDYLRAPLPRVDGISWPDGETSFQDAVLDYVADRTWRDNKIEARKALVDNLWRAIEKLGPASTRAGVQS